MCGVMWGGVMHRAPPLLSYQEMAGNNANGESGLDEIVSDVHVGDIARSHCSRWESLPPHLELDPIIVNDVKKDCPNDEQGRRRRFLEIWKERKGEEATYEKLIFALQAIECKEDAEYICQLVKSARSMPPRSTPASCSMPVSASGSGLDGMYLPGVLCCVC